MHVRVWTHPPGFAGHAGVWVVGGETFMRIMATYGETAEDASVMFSESIGNVLVVALAPTVRDLTGAGRRVVLGIAVPRFSLLALIAWGAMGFTGLYSAWLQVGNIPALTQTPYGQTLLLKLILIVPLLLLGAFNLAVVTRKLRQARTEERAEGWGGHFVTALMAEAAKYR